MTTTTKTYRSCIEIFLDSLYPERKTEVTNRVRMRLALPDLRERTEADIKAHGAHGNIWTVQNGAPVTADQFTGWLSKFMVFGSDVKLAMCELSAWTPISLFMSSGAPGFRLMTDNAPDPTTGIITSTFATPYGNIDLTSVKDEDPENPKGRVTVVDVATFIYDEEKWSAANGIASGILKIIA